LFRSMSRHLRKVNDQARDEEASAALMDDPGRAGDVGATGRDPRQSG
jgi:hypothetical protein